MGRQFTILLVEDESAVRDVLLELLRVHNFRVLAAADGYEAIRHLIVHHVDLLLTDIKMPGLSGYELAAQAKLIRPLLRVLYTTGYEGNAPGRDMAARHGKLLHKPIRPADLMREIEAALPP